MAFILGAVWIFSVNEINKDQNGVRLVYWADILLRTHLLSSSSASSPSPSSTPSSAPPSSVATTTTTSGSSAIEEGRGLLWQLGDVALKLFIELPLFAVASSGSRLNHFAYLQSTTGGLPSPFMNGVMLFSHQEVAGLLSRPHAKGHFLGGQKVPDYCMGPKTLIFLPSSSPQHQHLRSFLTSAIPSFFRNATWPAGIELMGEAPPTLAQAAEDSHLVPRYVVATLYARLFGKSPTRDEVDVFANYFVWGASCVLGPVSNVLTLGAAQKQITGIREAVYESVVTSPTIVGVLNKIASNNQQHCPGLEDQEAAANCPQYLDPKETVLQIVDGFLFAGMFGTTHLTQSTLDRIQSNPELYVTMFLEDPKAFMVEQARLDPPVTSVTSVFEEETTVHVGFGEVDPLGSRVSGGSEITYPKGAPIQLAISTANRDASVFGATAHLFDPKRANLSLALSWNGINSDVAQGLAPRGCPGRSLSLHIAHAVVRHFLPAVNAPPSGKPAPGDCVADSCVVQENPIIYERLPRSPHWYDILFAFLSISLAVYSMTKQSEGPVSAAWWFVLLSYICLLFGFLIDKFLLLELSWIALSTFIGLLALIISFQSAVLLGFLLSLALLGVAFLLTAFLVVVNFSLGYHFIFGSMVVSAIYFISCLTLFISVTAFLYKPKVRLTLFVVAVFPLAMVPNFGPLLSMAAAATGIVLMNRLVPKMNRAFPKGATLTSFIYHLPHLAKQLVRVVLFSALVLGSFMAYQNIQQYSNGALCHDQHNPLCFQSKLPQLDTYTRFLYQSVIDSVKSETADSPPGTVVAIPKRMTRLAVIEALPIPWYLPYEDENMPHIPFHQRIQLHLINSFLHSKIVFPLQDLDLMFDSAEEGKQTLRLAAGPLADGIDIRESTSDAAMTRWAFYGLGAHLLRRTPSRSLQNPVIFDSKETYVVDLLWMKDLEVRKPFRRFGAAAYFDSSQRLRRIALPEGNFFPGKSGWEHAKFVWRSSLLVGVTFKDHLALTHLKLSSIVVQTTREELPPHHPLRRLLAPFSYRTIEVNRGASSYLCAELGVLHRATALSVNGLVGGFQAALSLPARPLLKEQAEQGLAEVVPYVQDGLDFYRIVHRFVRSYFELYYPDQDSIYSDRTLSDFVAKIESFGIDLPELKHGDDLINIMVEYITMVTAFHHHVGTVTEYILDPQASCGKIRPNATMADVQTAVQTLVIALFTSFKQPALLSDFTHLLLHDEHLPKTTEIFNQFQASLIQLGHEIDDRNLKRPYPVTAFHPAYLLSAVSI